MSAADKHHLGPIKLSVVYLQFKLSALNVGIGFDGCRWKVIMDGD